MSSNITGTEQTSGTSSDIISYLLSNEGKCGILKTFQQIRFHLMNLNKDRRCFLCLHWFDLHTWIWHVILNLCKYSFTRNTNVLLRENSPPPAPQHRGPRRSPNTGQGENGRPCWAQIICLPGQPHMFPIEPLILHVFMLYWAGVGQNTWRRLRNLYMCSPHRVSRKTHVLSPAWIQVNRSLQSCKRR